MYKNQLKYTLVVFALLILVTGIVTAHGKNNRLFSPIKTIVEVDSPDKAYLVWREKNIRGRVLLLFDTYPHAQGLITYLRTGSDPILTQTNLVEYSILQNFLREVYYIVPEDRWNEVRTQKELKPLREVPDMEKGLFLFYKSGVPLIVTTPSSLPAMTEEVLVYINNRLFDFNKTMQILSHKNISSDIVISYKGRE